MSRIEQVATFTDYGGNTLRAITTATGIWRAGFWRKQGKMKVFDPQSGEHAFDTPSAQDWQLCVIDGELCVEYTRFLGYTPGTESDDPNRPIMRLYTGLPCGAAAGATQTAALGPIGPKGERGDKGDRGETGPRGGTGPQGAQGAAGMDGTTDPRIGRYEYGATIRGQLDAIEANVRRLIEGNEYIANQNRAVLEGQRLAEARDKALAATLDAVLATVKPPLAPTPKP